MTVAVEAIGWEVAIWGMCFCWGRWGGGGGGKRLCGDNETQQCNGPEGLTHH